MHRLQVVALMLAACSSPQPIEAHDANVTRDDAAFVVDGGADAAVVPGVDAFVASPDAHVDPDASLDTCSLAPQAGCLASQTCRRTIPGGPCPCTIAEIGPAQCVAFGTIQEGESRTCSVSDDQCGRGLFCDEGAACRRYCDPHGAPCADVNGSPYHCSPNSFGVYRCQG